MSTTPVPSAERPSSSPSPATDASPKAPPAPASTFGPTALLTPANLVTMVRLAATPVLVALVAVTGPSTWLLTVLWILVASSDGLDGVVARRQGATRSGAFLDPLADKILVVGVLAALAATGEVGWVAVGLIGAREGAMSGFRVYASRRGVSVPARPSAKAKTFLQDLAVGLALMPAVGAGHAGIVRDVLWVAVAVTLYTGLEYAHDARRLLSLPGRPTS